MKTRRLISTIALLLAACGAAAAQTAGGSYQFALEDGRTKYVEFDARAQADGAAAGRMFFSDEAPVTDQDVDGVGDPVETYNGFYFSAEFDGMTVSDNRAVISGVVRDSSIRALVGQRVLLTVEDNGDNTREPDRVTWGVYSNGPRGWEVSDAELERDPGVGMTWTATDSEREDDRGVRMPGVDSITTQTFPLAAYEFAATATGSGDIVVRP
ncbi:MAG TPA: hypothetical protein VF591_28060 [Pyrinomonadaceae bacterium]